MKNIEALIADGGDITIGAIYPVECVATAADDSNAIAMLVRRDGETLNALLKRSRHIHVLLQKHCHGFMQMDRLIQSSI